MIALTWRLIRYRPWLYVCATLLAVLIGLIDLVPGIVNQAFFDAVSGREHAGIGAWTAVALTLLQPLVRTVFKASAVMADMAVRFVIDGLVRRNALMHVLRHPGAQPLPEAPSAVANRLRDDAAQGATLVTVTFEVLTGAIFVGAALWIMARVDLQMTLFVFVPLVVVIVLAQRAFERLARYRRASRTASGGAAGLLGELFSVVDAVQLAGAEERVVAHFRRVSEARRQAMLRDTVATRLLEAVTSNAVGIGTGVILLLGAGAIRDGRFSVGDFALFAYYLWWVTYFVETLGRALPRLRLAMVGLERVAALLPEREPGLLVEHRPLWLRAEPPPLSLPARGADDRLRSLEARGLTFLYPDTSAGVQDVHLRLERGAFVVITGGVGAGKTTLLRALLGLVRPQAGEVHWNGEPVGDPAAFLVPPRAAYVPQVARLFSGTLRENVLLGLPLGDETLARALRSAVLERDVERLEHGLKTLLGPRGVRLSGGQVQRTAAARALVRDPELLVIDDVSSALDVETEQLLWERLFATNRERQVTVFAVSHRRAALERADRVVVLEGGRVVS